MAPNGCNPAAWFKNAKNKHENSQDPTSPLVTYKGHPFRSLSLAYFKSWSRDPFFVVSCFPKPMVPAEGTGLCGGSCWAFSRDRAESAVLSSGWNPFSHCPTGSHSLSAWALPYPVRETVESQLLPERGRTNSALIAPAPQHSPFHLTCPLLSNRNRMKLRPCRWRNVPEIAYWSNFGIIIPW